MKEIFQVFTTILDVILLLLFLVAIFAIFGKYDFQVYYTVYITYFNCNFVHGLKQAKEWLIQFQWALTVGLTYPYNTFMTYDFLEYYAILPGLHKQNHLKLCNERSAYTALELSVS